MRKHPIRPWEVARVAVGVLLEVVLVLLFGLPECAYRSEFSHHFAGPDSGLLNVSDRVFGYPPLLSVDVKDCGAVAGADVATLAIPCRRIVNLEEELKYLPIRHLGG